MTDTEWSPPIADGLSGDAYVEEELGRFVDDLAESHQPGVYALTLSTPDSRAVVEERWARAYDVPVQEFVWNAYDSATVLYVGAANNVFDRLYDHCEEPNRTASICRVFPPHSVWDVWWFDSADEAFERESGIAIDIRNEYPQVHVHQN